MLPATAVLDATGHALKLVQFDDKFDPGYQVRASAPHPSLPAARLGCMHRPWCRRTGCSAGRGMRPLPPPSPHFPQQAVQSAPTRAEDSFRF